MNSNDDQPLHETDPDKLLPDQQLSDLTQLDRFLLFVVEKLLPADWREPLIGDLLEERSNQSRVVQTRSRMTLWFYKELIFAVFLAIPHHITKGSIMNKILIPGGILLGLFALYVESRPTWDDMGVLAMGILATSFLFGLIEPRRPWLWALLIGGWIPCYEIVAHAVFAAIMALGFAFAGAYLGALSSRIFRSEKLAA